MRGAAISPLSKPFPQIATHRRKRIGSTRSPSAKRASHCYQRAIQDNPGETIFSQEYDSILSSRIGAPLNRAQASLTGYESWTAGRHGDGSHSETAHRKGNGPMNNQTLLSMAQAGLTDENLILAIDDAEEVAFDTTPNALISLAKGGVSKHVIAHMQRRAKR